MNKDIDKIIKRLIKISQSIIDEFAVLSDLSYHDRENTSQFNDHIEDIKNYLNSEAVIINNIDLKTLKEIFKRLPDYDDDTDAYERTHLNIDNRIEVLEQNEEFEDNEEIEYNENEYEESEYNEIDDEDDDDYIRKYYLDNEEYEKYELEVIDCISINILKQMYKRIINTYTDNKRDSKYQKRLLKNLKMFKYIVLGLDLNLEKIGVNYRFNLERIPNMNKPDIDTSTISYNQCITHLEKLYNTEEDENSISDINENLFNMMCLEVFLEDIDEDQIKRLLSLCDELEEHTTYHFYGNIAKEKILKKSKN